MILCQIFTNFHAPLLQWVRQRELWKWKSGSRRFTPPTRGYSQEPPRFVMRRNLSSVRSIASVPALRRVPQVMCSLERSPYASPNILMNYTSWGPPKFHIRVSGIEPFRKGCVLHWTCTTFGECWFFVYFGIFALLSACSKNALINPVASSVQYSY